MNPCCFIIGLGYRITQFQEKECHNQIFGPVLFPQPKPMKSQMSQNGLKSDWKKKLIELAPFSFFFIMDKDLKFWGICFQKRRALFVVLPTLENQPRILKGAQES